MSDVIITVDGIGKCYSLRHEASTQRYIALRDVIANGVKRLFTAKSASTDNQSPTEDFWALRGVAFEVKRAEVVGIIGRNGSGKSTLLKILSRITEPTTGRIRIRGRIASLLEVGTGFHPELTGRENIFLNGAILGMTRDEVTAKFDEIVAFAEIERFLDTPVKRYSSGMYVRLAFAVAAHLEPEILVVDEVLAVGDSEFQKKCLGKMESVSRSDGRTVLFVSHQMAAVQTLCQTGIHLSQGTLVKRGDIRQLVSEYLTVSDQGAVLTFQDRTDRQGVGPLRFERLSIASTQGLPMKALATGGDSEIVLVVRNHSTSDLRHIRITVGVDSSLGERLLVLSTHLAQSDFPLMPAGLTQIRIHIPKLNLAPGRYGLTLFSTVNNDVSDWIKHAGSFDVEPGDFYGNGQLPEQGQGSMLMEHRFSMAPCDSE